MIETPFYDNVPKRLADNIRYRIDTYNYIGVDEERQLASWHMCRRDLLYYINTFVWTFDPRLDRTKIPFITYSYQDDALLDLTEAVGGKDRVLEKSRDMGASWMCLLVFDWYWRFYQDKSFLVVSRNEKYVDEIGNPKALFWKLDFIQRNLPPWLVPAGWRATKHRKRLHLENPETGSVIDGESTTGDVARGDRRTAILLDEFAAVEEGYRVLRSTRDATKSRFFNSTPQGTGNAYYEVVKKAKERDDGTVIRMHWIEHPVKSMGMYTTQDGKYVSGDDHYWSHFEDPAGEMRRLDISCYAKNVPLFDGKWRSPWYCDEVDRCVHAAEVAQELDIDYLGSGFQFFKSQVIAEHKKKHAADPFLVGELNYGLDDGVPKSFIKQEGGHLHLWTLLDSHGDPPMDRQYAVGCDISAGTGASNSALSIWDCKCHEKVGSYVNPNIRPEAFAALAVAISRLFGDAYLIWESFGPGAQFSAVTMELGYRNVYWRKQEESVVTKNSFVPGFAPTPAVRNAAISEYRNALERDKVTNRDALALEETLQYVFLPTGQIEHARATTNADPSGAKHNHGDRCIADVLAWKAVRDRPMASGKLIPTEPPGGSFAARRREFLRQATKKGNTYWSSS